MEAASNYWRQGAAISRGRRKLVEAGSNYWGQEATTGGREQLVEKGKQRVEAGSNYCRQEATSGGGKQLVEEGSNSRFWDENGTLNSLKSKCFLY